MSTKKNQTFRVEVSVMDLKNRLREFLATGTKDAELISTTIIELLSGTEPGLKRLFTAMTGINPLCKWKPDDMVYVRLEEACRSWNADEDKTKESPLNIQGYLMAEVHEIKYLEEDCVRIKLNVINADNKKVEIYWDVRPESLRPWKDDDAL